MLNIMIFKHIIYYFFQILFNIIPIGRFAHEFLYGNHYQGGSTQHN
jgi:hypothetical protein